MSSKRKKLTPEQKELLPRIRSTFWTKKRLPPVSKDEKQYMVQVLETYEQYFASIKEMVDSKKPPFAQYDPALEEELLEYLDKQDQDKLLITAADVRDSSNKEETGADLSNLSEKLKPFSTQHLRRVLAPINGHIASLLPYLLAAYYINYPQKRRAYFDLFDGVGYMEDSNRYRQVDDFLKLFSLEDFIPKFLKKKHTRESAEVQAIKDKEAYEEYLGKPHQRRSPENLAYNLTEPQFNAIFQVFSYSLCVLACMSVPQISERVDYERSYKLFQQHTKAFSTVFWVDSRKPEEKVDNRALYYSTIENILSRINPAEIKKKIEESDYLEILKMCGISASDISSGVIDRKTDPVRWWRNVVIAIIYSLHPCDYPEWWNIEVKNPQSIFIQVFRKFLPYMDSWPISDEDDEID